MIWAKGIRNVHERIKSSEWKGSSVWQRYLSKSFENFGTANLKPKLAGFPTSKCRHLILDGCSKFSMFEVWGLPIFQKNTYFHYWSMQTDYFWKIVVWSLRILDYLSFKKRLSLLKHADILLLENCEITSCLSIFEPLWGLRITYLSKYHFRIRKKNFRIYRWANIIT